MTSIPDTPLPGAEGFVRHGCDQHGDRCPAECDHITTYGPRYRLYESAMGMHRAGQLCARRLAALLKLEPDAVRHEPVTDPLGVVIGFSLVLAKDGPYGYHRVTYTPNAQWVYCADPKYGPGDATCAFNLPDAPAYEAVEAGAETITYTTSRRNRTRASWVGHDDPVVCLRGAPAGSG